MNKTIVSLFDYTGEWCKPYRQAGYRVVQVDIKHGIDILNWEEWRDIQVHGILAAPPCTDFSGSGARWWPTKDVPGGSTERSLRLIDRTLQIIHDCAPQFWALENPVGRLGRLRPQIGRVQMRFHPCHYGDPYTKLTCLWGHFNIHLARQDVEPVMYETSTGKRGSYQWAHFGGKSEATKEARSKTPSGFARAFFQANP
jgi:hypothetical protein